MISIFSPKPITAKTVAPSCVNRDDYLTNGVKYQPYEAGGILTHVLR